MTDEYEITSDRKKLKGIKITSDGTMMGTKIYGADGTDLTRNLHVKAVTWSHAAGELPTAVLTCLLGEIVADRCEAGFKADE